MIDCPSCYGFGLLIPWPNAPYRTCSTCHGSGQVRGLCLECGEPLRNCDIGDNCLECVGHCEQHGSERLDTRPQDRAARARKRHAEMIDVRNFAAGQYRAALGTVYAGGWRWSLIVILIQLECSWPWRRMWDQAAVRRGVL